MRAIGVVVAKPDRHQVIVVVQRKPRLAEPGIQVWKMGSKLPPRWPLSKRVSYSASATPSYASSSHYVADGRVGSEPAAPFWVRGGHSRGGFRTQLCGWLTISSGRCSHRCYGSFHVAHIGAGKSGSANAPTATPIIDGDARVPIYRRSTDTAEVESDIGAAVHRYSSVADGKKRWRSPCGPSRPRGSAAGPGLGFRCRPCLRSMG